MSEILLFCCPGRVYKPFADSVVAECYSEGILDHLADIVDYCEDYVEFSEKPDFKDVVGVKEGIDNIFSEVTKQVKLWKKVLELSVFLDQPITRIGKLKTKPESLLLSWYSFNPEYPGPDFLPDLDVFVFEGLDSALAVDIVRDVYVRNRWVTATCNGVIDCTIVSPQTKRYSNSIYIMNPLMLRNKACELVNYDMNKLYF